MLFPKRTTLFLFDLTNTYLEGQCLHNDLAARGKSKEKRSDCPLVTLALLVDEYGFPVFSQIDRGNQSEPETLEHILERLKGQQGVLFQADQSTFVMDRGIATHDNIQLIKDQKYSYIVIERRLQRRTTSRSLPRPETHLSASMMETTR